MSRAMLRNTASNITRGQSRGVVTETITVGAAIYGAGKLIGSGVAAAGLIVSLIRSYILPNRRWSLCGLRAVDAAQAPKQAVGIARLQPP